jgi:methionine--tRNA ligase beta chain
VDRVSIIPAGMAGGYTACRPQEDKSYHTRSQLIEEIIIALGGRAAEAIILDEVSTGASSDLKKVNQIARNMVTKYGMSEKLGNMIFGNENEEVFLGRDYGHTSNYSDEVAGIIDSEIKHIIDSAYEKTLSLLRENIDKLNRLANVLLEKEKVEGADKLLKLKVSLGDEERQIVAGIAQYYDPETLPGKKIVIVANLAPATIRGVQSQGMLLAADIEGRAVVLTPDSDVPAGSKIR